MSINTEELAKKILSLDEALRLSGQKSLLESFPGWEYDEPFFLGETGIGDNRINIEEEGLKNYETTRSVSCFNFCSYPFKK